MPVPRTKLPTAFYVILAVTLLWSIAMAALLYRRSSTLADTVGYGVIPATQSLLNGQGLTICSETLAQTGNNPICFHSARMPMAEWILALAIHLFGLRLLPIAIFKTLLFLIPLYAAIAFALRATRAAITKPGSTRAGPPHLAAEIWVFLFLLLPFAITPFWLDIVSLDFEESYTYGLIALAFAIAIFWNANPRVGIEPKARPFAGLLPGLLVGLTIAAIYLSKSSMLPAAAVLLLACLYVLPDTLARTIALVLALAAPIAWAAYQHHVSGRYTLGTSLDGFNLHMGNSPNFLRDYPPIRSLDDTASQLNAGHSFPSEWAFNDYHQRAALAFIRSHPAATLHGEWRKLRTIFLSINNVGAWRRHGLSFLVESAGLLAFRLLFWLSLILSAWHLLRGPTTLRWPSAVFLAFVAAAMLPYLLGFGYTRHVSILIYPTVLFCCRLLQPPTDPVTPSAAR